MAKKVRRSSRSSGRGGRGRTGLGAGSTSRGGGGSEPSRVLLAELIAKMEDEDYSYIIDSILLIVHIISIYIDFDSSSLQASSLK